MDNLEAVVDGILPFSKYPDERVGMLAARIALREAIRTGKLVVPLSAVEIKAILDKTDHESECANYGCTEHLAQAIHQAMLDKGGKKV